MSTVVGNVTHHLMVLRDQIKVYHWQTMTYSRHIATNDLLTKLDANLDQFVEVMIGKYGRPKFVGKAASLPIRNFHDEEAPELLRQAVDWMSNELPNQLKKMDTDLLNIRDTIVGDLNQVLYLFSFNK